VCRIRLVVDPPLIDNVTVQVSHLALSAEILVKLFHTRVPGYAQPVTKTRKTVRKPTTLRTSLRRSQRSNNDEHFNICKFCVHPPPIYFFSRGAFSLILN
jgi:hypothetical protein